MDQTILEHNVVEISSSKSDDKETLQTETPERVQLVYEVVKTPTKQQGNNITPSSSPEVSLSDIWDKICGSITPISDNSDTKWTPVKDYNLNVNFFTKESDHGTGQDSKEVYESITSESPTAKRIPVKDSLVKNSVTVTVEEVYDVEEDSLDPPRDQQPKQTTKKKSTTRRSATGSKLQDNLNKILPTNIRDLLQQDSKRCVAITTIRKRCTAKHKKSVEDIQKTLKALETKPFETNPDICLDLMRDLIKYAQCNWHHSAKNNDKLERIRRTRDTMPETDHQIFLKWIESIQMVQVLKKEDETKTKTSIDESSSDVPKIEEQIFSPFFLQISRTIRPEARKVYFSPKSRMLLSNGIMQFQVHGLEKTSISKRLLDFFGRRLLKTEVEPANLYIYWIPGEFGKIKIGLTKKATEKRIKEWKSKCKQEVQLLYSFQNVKHAALVEKMVQTELVSGRVRKTKCEGCHKSHTEWFDVNLEHAVKVLTKFKQFTEKDPFEYVLRGGIHSWWFKQDMEKELKQLCLPTT